MVYKVKRGFPGLNNFIKELQNPEVKAEVIKEQINAVAAEFSPAEKFLYCNLSDKPAALKAA